MKIILFLIIISTAMAFSANSYSQNTNLSMELNNVTVKDVLKTIEKQSEFLFFYQEKHVDLNRQITIRVYEQDIETILNQLFAGTDNIYVINDRQIVIGKAPRKELEKQIQNIKGNVEPVIEQPQGKEITGKVTDDDGLPLPGVTVIVKGTTIGTVTNADGDYTIANVPEDATLVFSFVGMQMQEVEVGNQTNINIEMAVDAIGIEEVVAVGYGTQSKRNISSSVSTIDNESIRNLQGTSLEQGLLSTSSGVEVSQTTGRPGGGYKINIRGVNNLSGSNPLYVIDGVQYSGGYDHMKSPLTFIDPQDIESMQILKDAAAASIYGSEGAGGVIIITTKRGKPGKADIQFEYNIGIQEAIGIPEVMNASTYAEAMIEARQNDYLDAVEGASITDPDEMRNNHRHRIGIFEAWKNGETQFEPIGFSLPIYLDPNGVNWIDEVLRDNPKVTTYRLNATGGTDKINYYIGGSYRNEEGLFDGYSGFERYSLRANIDSKLNDWITVNANLSPYYTYQKNMLDEGRIHMAGFYTSALASSPITAVYRPDGLYQSNITGHVYGIQNNENPVMRMNDWIRYNNSMGMMGATAFNFNLIKGLDFNTSASVNYNNTKYVENKPYHVGRAGLSGGYPDMTEKEKARRRFKSNEGNVQLYWQLVQRLSYSTSFKENHDLKLMAAFETSKNRTDLWSIDASYYPSDFFPHVILSSENIVEVDSDGTFKAVRFGANTNIRTATSASVLGRLDYSYKNRYNLTATIRRDGYSGFGPENKWGTFPSIALGWIVSEENFMEDIDQISLLKLRYSTGTTGRKSGYYNWLTSVNPTNYVDGSSIVNGYKSGSLRDRGLAWEELNSTTFGAELGIFNNRIYLTTEYFINKNSDFVTNLPVPSLMGQTNIQTNFGNMETKGFELALNTFNISKRNFKWESNFNASYMVNRLKSFGLDQFAKKYDGVTDVTHITEVDAPMSNFFLRPAIGIYTNQEDLSQYPIGLDGNGSRLGERRYMDVNRDGIVTKEDQMVMGSPWPKWVFGFTNKLLYKNIDLSINMNGKLGHKIYDRGIEELYENNTNMVVEKYTKRWQSPENPGDGFPILGGDKAFKIEGTSVVLFDASYLALRNVTLGYNLQHEIIRRNLGIQGLRVYCTVENAFFIKDYYGNPDAEASERLGGSAYHPEYAGTEYGTYPLARTYMMGVSITF